MVMNEWMIIFAALVGIVLAYKLLKGLIKILLILAIIGLIVYYFFRI